MPNDDQYTFMNALLAKPLLVKLFVMLLMMITVIPCTRKWFYKSEVKEVYVHTKYTFNGKLLPTLED